MLCLSGDVGNEKILQVVQILVESEQFKTKRVILVLSSDYTVEVYSKRLGEEIGGYYTIGSISAYSSNATSSSKIIITTPHFLASSLVTDPLLNDVRAVIIPEPQLLQSSPYLDIVITKLRELCVKSLKKTMGNSTTSDSDISPTIIFFFCR